MVLKTTGFKMEYKRVHLSLRMDHYEYANKIAFRNKTIKKYGAMYKRHRFPSWELLKQKAKYQWQRSSLLQSQFLYQNDIFHKNLYP